MPEKRVGFRPETPPTPAGEHDLLLTKLATHLRPELLGRIRTIVEFKPLDKEAVALIVKKYFDAICKRAALQSPMNVPPPELCGEIVSEIGDLKYGAREIEKRVETRLSTWLDKAKSKNE